MAVLAASASPGVPAEVTGASHLMTVTTVDAVTGDTLETRCNVIDSLGFSRHTPPAYSFYHQYREGFFYSEGTFTLEMPPGPVTVRAGRGPEYLPVRDEFALRGDTSIVYSLQRVADMRSAGWIPGDTHVHINHFPGHFTMYPAGAHLIGRGEGLAVVNCLDNGYFFTGRPDSVSDEECIVFMSEEFRSPVWGHVAMPGMRRLFEPPEGGWMPMILEAADSVHAQDGPLAICAHPVTTEDFEQIEEWPGSGLAREIPVDMIYGSVDGFEVMSYSNREGHIETALWYRLLGCGFRLPPVAGTDAAANRLYDPPTGGFRTYALVEDWRGDIYQWLSAIASGRTFVTNMPLFTAFEVLGHGAGDSLYVLNGTYAIPVSVKAECAMPMDRVEVLVNGRVAATLHPGADSTRIEGAPAVYVHESSWIAARALGRARGWFQTGDTLFAHTGPFYIDMDGRRAARKEDAMYFVAWIDSLAALTAEKGSFASAGDSLAVLGILRQAREWYMSLAAEATSAEGTVPSACTLRLSVNPNPFSVRTTLNVEISPGPAVRHPGPPGGTAGGVRAVIDIFDVSGRLVRTVLDDTLEPGKHSFEWDGMGSGGRKASAGVYFARVTAGGSVSTRKMVLIR